MKINAIDSLSYKGVSKYALDKYLQKYPQEEYSKKFMNFVKQQSQNKNFHIHYDDLEEGFIVAKSNYFVEKDLYNYTKTYRNFEKNPESLKRIFDDIYKAGDYANKLEQNYSSPKSDYGKLVDYIV